MDYYSPLSPGALSSLGNRKKRGEFNKAKNDVWAAGITILATLFNEDYLKYYDWQCYSVNIDMVKHRLGLLLKNGFDSKFVKILNRMLEFSDMERFAINELVNAFEVTKKFRKNDQEASQRDNRNTYNTFNKNQTMISASTKDESSLRDTFGSFEKNKGQQSSKNLRGSQPVNILSGNSYNEQNPLGDINQNYFNQKYAKGENGKRKFIDMSRFGFDQQFSSRKDTQNETSRNDTQGSKKQFDHNQRSTKNLQKNHHYNQHNDFNSPQAQPNRVDENSYSAQNYENLYGGFNNNNYSSGNQGHGRMGSRNFNNNQNFTKRIF